MGGLVRSVFGGSKSKSKQLSENQAFKPIMAALQPNIGLGNTAMATLSSMLGIGDPAAGKAATENFLDSTGYQTILDSGRNAIRDRGASRGLFNSGATGKALVKYGQDLGKTKVSELMDKLLGLGQYGLGSAQTIAGAGQKSTGTSTSTSSNGIFNSLFPSGLSDRRVKRHITKVGNFQDGLGLYEYEYVFAPGKRFRGVMADEVAALRPEAVGPKAGKYDTVNYDMIPELEDGPILVKERV